MTFVKVSGSRDRWARSGWCFETLFHESGGSESVLERVTPPRREVSSQQFTGCFIVIWVESSLELLLEYYTSVADRSSFG